MSDNNKVSALPDGVRKDALKIAQSCYSMGVFQTALEFVFGPEKNTDGSYKNPWTEAGRAAIRESCFNEAVVPKILSARGTEDDLRTIRNIAKNNAEGDIKEARSGR